MNAPLARSPSPTGRRVALRRTGAVLKLVLVALIGVAVIGLAVWYFMSTSNAETNAPPILTEVVLEPYEHVVLEQGEVESSKNVEVRCEVKARTAGGSGTATTILEIVPEGTQVKEGEWLITFDASALEDEKTRQQIVVNNSETLVIQAESTYRTAEKEREEYLDGTFVQSEKTILNEIYVAEDARKNAELNLRSAERLLARGLIDALQVGAHRTAVEKATNELQLAQIKLKVLRDITKEKEEIRLDSNIKAAKVKWENEQKSHEEELKKLADIEDQIKKCTVTAPSEGTVVYANVQSSRSGSEFVVEQGVAVKERQVIIKLPDPQHMQVKAKINEARINLVKQGMPVSIRIDAFGDQSLRGEVVKVNKYAEAGNWWSSTAKQYATTIRIVDPPPTLRSGLTAEVRIHVDMRPKALQVPVQAVYEHERRTFCLVKDGKEWETRRVLIASTNDKTIVIDEEKSEKFQPGDQVVMNPRDHVGKFDFARFPSPPPTEVVAVNPGDFEDSAGQSNGGENDEADSATGAEPGARGGQPEGGGQFNAAAMIARTLDSFDTDKDGTLSADELNAIPEERRGRLIAADTNGDGSVDRTELTVAMNEVMKRIQQGGGGLGGQPGGGGP